MNPFETLGLPAKFDLDEAELQRRFIAASAAAHPDRYTDPLDQADAVEKSAVINEAYRTLRDPEARANALLAVLGGPGKEEDKSLPPELLAEMMDVRERMEEAAASKDAAALAELRAWADVERGRRLGRVGGLFLEVEKDAKPQAATLRGVRLELNALRYVERMIEQMPGRMSDV